MSDRCTWGREDLLSAYLDGELRSGELEDVVAHLDSCAACVGILRRVKEGRTALRQLPVLEPPVWLASDDHASDRLSAYLDGELGADAGEAVAEHVGACAQCREELQELDAARVAVRALPRLELPAGVAVRTSLSSAPSKRRRLVALVAAAAVAAMLLGAVALRPDPVVQPLDLDELATRHHARASVEAGFSVIPASVSGGGSP